MFWDIRAVCYPSPTGWTMAVNQEPREDRQERAGEGEKEREREREREREEKGKPLKTVEERREERGEEEERPGMAVLLAEISGLAE